MWVIGCVIVKYLNLKPEIRVCRLHVCFSFQGILKLYPLNIVSKPKYVLQRGGAGNSPFSFSKTVTKPQSNKVTRAVHSIGTSKKLTFLPSRLIISLQR